MTVNNFLYDICRPVYKYLSQGSFMYTTYYNYRLGIPPPTRRRRLSSVTSQPIQIKILPRSTSKQLQDTGALAINPAPQPHVVAQYRQPRGTLSTHFAPPLLIPPPPTPATTAILPSYNNTMPLLPVYNSTKIPLQPIPNHNFYFTYPQPKPKQYVDPYYDPVSANNNYPYYYTMIPSMKQPP